MIPFRDFTKQEAAKAVEISNRIQEALEDAKVPTDVGITALIVALRQGASQAGLSDVKLLELVTGIISLLENDED